MTHPDMLERSSGKAKGKEKNSLIMVFSIFSSGCLKSGKPSTFVGDVFFDLTCETCCLEGLESCTRQNLSW